MWILGLNGPPIGWHDASACLVDETGRVWAMAEEERFTRVKHALRTYPQSAARFCLDSAGIQPQDLDVIAIGWDLPKLGVLVYDASPVNWSRPWSRLSPAASTAPETPRMLGFQQSPRRLW